MKILVLLFCLVSFNLLAATTQKQQNFCDTGLVHILLNDDPPQEFYIELNKTQYKYIWFHELNTALMIYWDHIETLNNIETYLRNQIFISSVQCLENKDFKSRQ
jgi:hypothetical protein